MRTQSSYTTTDLEHDPKLFVKLFARVLAGSPTVIEDKKTGQRVIMVQVPESNYKDPWGEPPKEILEQWEQDRKEFESENRKNPRPCFTSGTDFVEYMNRRP